MGLSPRVRGNPRLRNRARHLIGSIPACAGEPEIIDSQSPRGKVYPRVCGGTEARLGIPTASQGLSPRVRGNHGGPCCRGIVEGSIPARAGEPSVPHHRRLRVRVYPRACGGTVRKLGNLYNVSGLSPRVRGNLHLGYLRRFLSGSIPARAGEPPAPLRSAARSGVYPRACGGTKGLNAALDVIEGLSPRVRGNRNVRSPECEVSGSIPARAGEPRGGSGQHLCPWVYPRACGGTHSLPSPYSGFRGLSPRVRGNRNRKQDI